MKVIISRIWAWISRIWAWITTYERPLLVSFTFVGGLYAIIQYELKVDSDKVIETMKFVELYTSPPILNAQLDHQNFSRHVFPDATPETYNDIAISNENEKTDRMVYTLLEFFNTISICIENNICKKALACQYFFQDSQDLMENTRPILNILSETWKIDLLERFAHEHCISEFRAYCSNLPYQSPDCPVMLQLSGGV